MKALRTAAFVVGAAALVASGIGAAVGAGILGGVAAGATTATFAGLSAATFTTIGAALSATAGALSIAAGAAAPKGTVGGNATKFKIDKEAGIPVIIGRTYSAGNVVHRQYYDNPTSKMRNQLESWVAVHSLGPVRSIGPLLIDKTTAIAFDDGGAAIGDYRGNMWLDTQMGACPEPRALRGPFGDFAGWAAATSKLSGLAADLWSLDFDSKGKKFPNGVPERGRIIEGMFAYDARLDSTYPGGAGACRLGVESSYVWSENPSCHAVTWAFGRYQNGLLMAGGGMAAEGIDLQPFVEWSNVCDANGWKVGGQIFSTSDDAWDVLKMICQAGAAEPMPVGAQLSVTFSAPRVSIGTITTDDLAGDADVPAGVTRRQRRNTIIPKVRLESHGWEEVPLEPISVADYVAVDGGRRPREVSYPLVQDAEQAGTLAAYDILNMREIDGIVLPCKVYAVGYRPGDQLTIRVPEALLDGRDVVIRNRGISAASLVVQLTCRTETAGKHTYALGQTGTPPPTPDLSKPVADTRAPDVDDWSVSGGSLAGSSGSIPALVLTGSPGSLAAEAIVFDYRSVVADAGVDDGWISAGIEVPTTTRKEISSVTPGGSYQVSVRYRARGLMSDRLILGPVTTGDLATSRAAHQILSGTQTVAYPVSSTADTVTVIAFDATIDTGARLSFPAVTLGGLSAATGYVLLWSLQTADYMLLPVAGQAAIDASSSGDNVIVRYVNTATAGGSYPADPTPPGGDGGGGYNGRPVVNQQ